MRELAAWLRTRVAQPRIAVLCVLVAAAILAAGAIDPMAATLALSVVLVVQFRLWDDLEDLPHDRVRAPDRELARSANPAPFRIALGASIPLAALAIAWAYGGDRAGAYLALVLALAAIYRATGASGPHRALRAQLVLLKYPAFVLLLAVAPNAMRAIAAALALAVVLGVHEWRDRGAEATR